MGRFEGASIAALREAYSRGENIMSLLSQDHQQMTNGFAAIQVAYDLQAGSYTEDWEKRDGARFKREFAEALLPHLAGYRSLLDAGVGEATTLVPLLHGLGGAVRTYGFDASVSRLLWARRNLSTSSQAQKLFVADTAEIPLRDASIDLVLSVHSVEPNGGREPELLTELLRVAARRLVLVEPSTAFASATQLERMRRHGYCSNLPSVLEKLGADVVLHEPWHVNSNPDNAAELIVVDVERPSQSTSPPPTVHPQHEFVAPASLADLEAVESGLYSRHDGLYFPVVGGFPILTRAQAIIATQLLDAV